MEILPGDSMYPGKSVRITLLCNLDDRLTMSVECSLPIFRLKVSVDSGGLLVFVIQYGADQMQGGSIAY
jgi:hypothetical protein